MRWRLRPEERAPDPEPLATDDRAAIAAGTAVWVALAVLAAVFHAHLAAHGRGWWLPAALAGVALGLVGLWHEQRRRRRSRR